MFSASSAANPCPLGGHSHKPVPPVHCTHRGYPMYCGVLRQIFQRQAAPSRLHDPGNGLSDLAFVKGRLASTGDSAEVCAPGPGCGRSLRLSVRPPINRQLPATHRAVFNRRSAARCEKCAVIGATGKSFISQPDGRQESIPHLARPPVPLYQVAPPGACPWHGDIIGMVRRQFPVKTFSAETLKRQRGRCVPGPVQRGDPARAAS